MHDGTRSILKDVRYVPELKSNQISLDILDLLGYTFKAEKRKLTVFKGSLVLMKGVRSNGLCTLTEGNFIGSASTIESDQTTTMLWHLRLTHISDIGLQELYK